MYFTAREIAAYHEAGHVIAALHCGCRIRSVCIDNDRHGNGLTRVLYPIDNTRRQTMRRLHVCLAGYVSESRLLKQPPTLVRSIDLDDAVEYAHRLTYEDQPEAERLIYSTVERLQRFFCDPRTWQRVEALAEGLLLAGELDEAAVAMVLNERGQHVIATA
jgi:hypothetical protein